MTSKIVKKGVIIVVCIATATGAVVGILVGILQMAVSGESGYIALIVASAVVFVVAVAGIFDIISPKNPSRDRSKRDSNGSF